MQVGLYVAPTTTSGTFLGAWQYGHEYEALERSCWAFWKKGVGGLQHLWNLPFQALSVREFQLCRPFPPGWGRELWDDKVTTNVIQTSFLLNSVAEKQHLKVKQTIQWHS